MLSEKWPGAKRKLAELKRDLVKFKRNLARFDQLAQEIAGNDAKNTLISHRQNSECAKGAANASCGETVVQKGVFGESVSTLPP